jgi:hypothetical protein
LPLKRRQIAELGDTLRPVRFKNSGNQPNGLYAEYRYEALDVSFEKGRWWYLVAGNCGDRRWHPARDFEIEKRAGE